MSTQIDPIVAQAIRSGILPDGAAPEPVQRGNWPLMLLSFLGAWLVALPFVAVLALLVGDWIERGSGAPVLGVLFLGIAIALLRRKDLPLFVEQLALPGLLLGGGLLAYALFDHLPDSGAALGMSALALAIGWLVRGEGVRVVLGAFACLFFIAAIASLASLGGGWRFSLRDVFLQSGLLIVVALWAALDRQASRIALGGGKEDHAIFLDRVLLGWVCAALFGLSVASGRTFLFSELTTGPLFGRDAATGYRAFDLLDVLSSAMSVLGMWLLVRRWPALKAEWLMAPALAVAALALVMPALGPCLLVACIALADRRWGLAVCAALAALWIVGGFYYSLAYPLALKAGMLLAAAIVLAVPAWWRLRGEAGHAVPLTPGQLVDSPSPAYTRPLLALGCAAVLAVANIGIWEKERLIGASRVLYVELGPVDPRSLMQGDFMRLAFQLPPQPGIAQRAGMLYAVGTIDRNAVVRFSRYQDHARVGPGEVAMRLSYRHGRWLLVTDAWFFEEGSAKKWEGARFGEFRVDGEGKALLVGMRDGQLRAIR